MTAYEPIQTSTIETKLGTFKIVINSNDFVQLFPAHRHEIAEGEEPLVVNGVAYGGRIAFQRKPDGTFQIERHERGDYEVGISLCRNDDISKKPTDSARAKIREILPAEVTWFLYSDQGTTLRKSAERRNAEAKLARAKAKVQAAKDALTEAQQELLDVEVELGLKPWEENLPA